MTAAMLSELSYCSVPSPLGELFLAASEAGLCRIAWEVSEDEFVVELEAHFDRSARRDEPGVAGNSARRPPSAVLTEAVRQLGAYFAGQHRAFELSLDLTRLRPFQRRVLTALLEVPYGEVVSYGELALLAGCPGAARAVGGAMRGNPLPIVIPCHRVLLSSGGLGGFGGRPHLKRQLLALEGSAERQGPKQHGDTENSQG